MKIEFPNFLRKSATELSIATALVAGSPNSTKAEDSVKDANTDSKTIGMEKKIDVTKDPKTFVMNDKEGNEYKEKQFELEFAKEAASHVGQDAYVSKLKPGVILVSEKRPSRGDSNLIVTIAYPTTVNPKTNEYKAYEIVYEGEKLNENSYIKIETRDLGSRLTDVSIAYSVLRAQGKSPIEAFNMIKESNSSITPKDLSNSILKGLVGNDDGKDRLAALEDIKVLENILQPIENKDLASAGK